jgi:hypothetical protein
VQDGANSYSTMKVDGTDFKINEPYPFNPMWFSQKFKSSGVRYEVAISIKGGGGIVHIYGPVPCGSCPAINNFRACLINRLLAGEMVEADNGYRGESTIIMTPVDFETLREEKQKPQAIAHHETCSTRFNNWGCLKQTYRHNLHKHKQVFGDIVVFPQLEIEHGEILFGVQFD